MASEAGRATSAGPELFFVFSVDMAGSLCYSMRPFGAGNLRRRASLPLIAGGFLGGTAGRFFAKRRGLT